MEDEKGYRKELWSQLTEAYAKEVYTRQTYNVAANGLQRLSSGISIVQIVLTAVSTVGFIGVLLGQTYLAAVYASAASVVALGFNLYTRGAKLTERVAQHVQTANDLWLIENRFTSLLTDFDEIPVELICERRDALISELDGVYRKAPRTTRRQYEKAKKDLKIEGAQSFEDGEVDTLLPANIRGKYK